VLFPTTDFAIFFVVVFLGHWLLNHRHRPWRLFMLAASYVFYSWWDWRFVFLLAACTVFAQAGAVIVHRSSGDRARRAALTMTLVALLGLLGWFKYYGFFAVNLANLLRTFGISPPLPLLQITLPVGISFFTFMAVSYVIDVYRRVLVPAPWLDFAVYLSFFPHLVAGPIVRGGELIPQIRTRRDPRRIDLGRAGYLILSGLFRKVVLSSFIASAIVDPVFGSPGQHSSLEVLFAIYGYAMQIYWDFSGYTDIAIGLALLLGFTFPENFNAPYAALSVQDFWRRWHITLSRWLRDYLYIPLGGNRKGRARTYANLMITMLLGGLWHGASWTFVAWGGLHGAGLVFDHRRAERRAAQGLPLEPQDARGRALHRLATFHFVCLGWVFFRAGSFALALQVLARLFTGWFQASPLVTPLVLLAVAVGIGTQYVPRDVPERAQAMFSRLMPPVQGVVAAGALFAITLLGPQGVAPFIYFRF
jgi:D-alanyl-lipoteichoic acid acyltransferase DltB (MBOAT superfamily)